MHGSRTGKLLLTGCALALAACGGGGGGGGGTNFIPAPPPAPTPTPTPPSSPLPAAIIPSASTSQQFAGKGVTFENSGAPATSSDDWQLQIRYDAVNSQYEVALPSGTSYSSWHALSGSDGNYTDGYETHTNFADSTGYSHSALATWENTPVLGFVYGAVALGIATPGAGVPVTGAATYNGQIAGRSNEMVPDNLTGPWPAYITGSVEFTFNFGAGSLTGSLNPTLNTWNTYQLPSLSFTNVIYATGSPTFSGNFGTTLAGQNSFSGLFTGPNAQELIGNFLFPYVSPEDGQPYQAGGAFIGRRP